MREHSDFMKECDQAIDFHKVLEQISTYTSFSLSKEAILHASPKDDLYEIQKDLDFCAQSLAFLQKGNSFVLEGIEDISMALKKADKQMILSPQELMQICSVLVAVQNIKTALNDDQFPLLMELADSMETYPKLIQQIQSKIDGYGMVKEDATPLLRALHQDLFDQRAKLSLKTKQFLKQNASMLMEDVSIDMQSRTTFLVKAQDKYSFGGMIHGQSQSGQAYYVEPQDFVEQNSKIQTILSEIEAEKRKICNELTMEVKKVSFQILSNLETLTYLDVSFTKAKWAYTHDGCIPHIQTRDHTFYFEHAKHPLINDEDVISNTYRLYKNQYCLMISGPNMGGKTVTLKTIGLFVVLSHCGFPVLCHRATLPYYTSIWFDIGDQQSIENNLSTFSSHISKIARICKEADDHSFILLDEIGNGTDPLEGACLAQAIIEHLIQKQSTLITSTHYSSVKTYGKSNPSILVSSVEFDLETLQPTYKYIEGISGLSYAFDIACHYHLDSSILENAKLYKEENKEEIEKKVEELEKQQAQVLQQKERFHNLIQDAHRLQKEAKEQEEKIRAKKKELDDAYQFELNMMLMEKEQQAKSIIKSLKKDQSIKPHEQSAKLHELRSMHQQENVSSSQEKHEFKVHDYVKIEGLNSHGEIIDIRKKEATILTNGMKMKVKLSQLKPMNKPKVEKVVKKHTDRTFQRFPLELNIIGMRVEEGLQALDHYIDQAVVNHIKQVRIIHGMGTGALRNAVWTDLKKHPQVKLLSPGGPNEGGLGATIVTLK